MYSIGDKVVHPMHGAGIMESIINKKINGVTRSYYVLKLFVNNMQVLIPVETCDEIGVRPIVDSMTANNVISSIKNIKVTDESNWNKRYRDNMLNLKSGDVMKVAQVVKSLSLREQERGLSAGERKMLNSAKQILISELVLAKSGSTDKDYSQVEHEINNVILGISPNQTSTTGSFLS